MLEFNLKTQLSAHKLHEPVVITRGTTVTFTFDLNKIYPATFDDILNLTYSFGQRGQILQCHLNANDASYKFDNLGDYIQLTLSPDFTKQFIPTAKDEVVITEIRVEISEDEGSVVCIETDLPFKVANSLYIMKEEQE